MRSLEMSLPKDELTLSGRPVLDAMMFQEKWGKLSVWYVYLLVALC